MKYYTTALLLAASTAQVAAVGNGQTTNNIKFSNLPGSYTYQRAVSIDVSSGTAQCQMGNVQAKGPLAPLTNEMHYIFRGPMNLVQFAVYQPSAPSKRDGLRESPMERRGRVNHLAKHKKPSNEKRSYGDMVTATINGQVVTFADDWSPHAATPAAEPVVNAAAEPTRAAKAAAPVVALQHETPDSAPASPSEDSFSVPETQSTSDITSSTWSRSAFYDAKSKTAENIMFTANNKWATGLGFTQGYVASNGVDSAAGPNILSGDIPDNYEVIISAGAACSTSDKTGGCAVVAPGSDSHHGFGGDRVVIMEYTMPQSSGGAANKFTGNAANTNIPAIWSLGSDLVNIAQYGMGPGGACSGWISGSGEFDIHEVLPAPMDNNLGYASFHMGDKYSGTAPEALVRPTDPSKTQKLAVVFSGDYAGIHVLGSDFDLDEGLSPADVNAIVSGSSSGTASKSAVKTSVKMAKAGAPAYPVSVESAVFPVLHHS